MGLICLGNITKAMIVGCESIHLDSMIVAKLPHDLLASLTMNVQSDVFVTENILDMIKK